MLADQSGIDPALHQLLARTGDGVGAGIERLSDQAVAPGRAGFRGIGLQQDACLQRRAGRTLPFWISALSRSRSSALSLTMYLFTVGCFAVTTHLQRLPDIDLDISRKINDAGQSTHTQAPRRHMLSSRRLLLGLSRQPPPCPRAKLPIPLLPEPSNAATSTPDTRARRGNLPLLRRSGLASRRHRAWPQIPLLRASADHHHLRGLPALGPPASIHRCVSHPATLNIRSVPSRTPTTQSEPKRRKITASLNFKSLV